MTPIYVVLAGWLWRLWGKKVALWYVHRSVDLKLKVAHLFVNQVFSAVPESFRLKSDKAIFLGHGIDVEKFSCPLRTHDKQPMENSKQLLLLVVGRITPIKHPREIIEAARILKEEHGISFALMFVGAPVSRDDVVYGEQLQQLVGRYGLESNVVFEDSVPNDKIPQYYCDADIALNIVPTGGLDKTVIEAMAAGRLIVSTNEGFRQCFAPFDELLIPQKKDGKAIADTILRIVEYNKKDAVTVHLKKVARERFTIEALIQKLSRHLQS